MCTSSLLNCVQSRFQSQVQLAFLIWNLVSVSLHHQKLAFKLVRETLLIRMPLFVEKSYQSESPSILKGSSSFLACQFSSSTFTIILLNLFSLTSKTPDNPFSTCVSHASLFLPFLFFFFWELSNSDKGQEKTSMIAPNFVKTFGMTNLNGYLAYGLWKFFLKHILHLVRKTKLID